MTEVYIRTQRSFRDADGGTDDINGGSYDTGSSFDPTQGKFCATVADFADGDIKEYYCAALRHHQFVVLYSSGTRLQFCEIQVNDYKGIFQVLTSYFI